MNTEHRYTLEKGSKKTHCPDCNKKTFVLYIDTETGNHLPEQYGRCDRESKCSYHLNPYLDGYAKAIWKQEQGNRSELPNNWKPKRKKAIPQPPPEPVFFDFETFKQTLQPERYEQNTFIQNLFYRVQFPFEVDEVEKVINLYRLGTAPNGATCFPFINKQGFVNAIQEKHFDHTNSTDKSKKYHTSWAHTRLQYNDYKNKPLPEWLEAYTRQDKRISCLFGEHLLSKYHSNPVALVEAPKTAIYCWLYFNKSNFPIYKDCIWLAVGAKGYLNFDVAKILKGRFVYVLPDLSKDGSTFKEWETKAKEYESRLPGTRFIMDDILEQYGTPEQRAKGADIADVLNFDWRTIRAVPEPPQPEPEKVTGVTKVTPQQNIIFSHIELLANVKQLNINKIDRPVWEQLQNWSNDIAELENYFASIELPAQPIKLKQAEEIKNCSLFIESHIATVKENNRNINFLPFLNRLQELKQVLTIYSQVTPYIQIP
ncbi:MAG TPA: DUF6371 domain-containing protein [Saprospiraceae bacterium]|nr:DUF6371 domain-containing protein [Saprospiraceae bacterium]